ncbi:MAG: hypothetical protein WD875_14315 [Pirellulales bacterium]
MSLDYGNRQGSSWHDRRRARKARRSNRPRRRNRHSAASERRGVILLLIISLLSLFSMIAITYVVSAGSHKKSSYAITKGGGYYGTDPKEIADRALYYTLVGTTNPRSPFVFHDMLGDMYGHFGIGGKLAAVAKKANGEMLEITLSATPNMPFGRANMEEMGYLAGSVITLLDGEGIGLSTHIIWQSLETPTIIRVRPWIADEPRKIMPAPGDRFWINGQPFSGMGFGYNKSTHRLDAEGEAGPIRESVNFGEVLGKNVNSFRDWVDKADKELLFGGANEEYDAPDIDNMFMAFVPGNPSQRVIPSFHRPALVRKAGASKKTMLRPLKEDNPNFTGSNPNFDPVEGEWDVDNDRDGRQDSIWLDPGWPAQVAANGQTYKHLVAIMVRPLDGGIDINAVGNMAHAAQQGAEAPKGGYGLATGAAELDPTVLSATPNWFRKILGQPSGNSGNVNPNDIGRYGADGQPGTKQDQDRLRKSRQLNYPENWEWQPVNPMARDFGSPPPLLWSTRPLEIDPNTGQVNWSKPPPTSADGAKVSPYELDLSRNAPRGPLTQARDAPFTYAEYERCIRRNDGDVTGLPERLWNLLPDELKNYPYRISPGNFDVPGPNVQVRRTVREMTLNQSPVSGEAARVAKSYVDILRARIKKAGGEESMLLEAYVPAEMRAGLRMDLNRPFGNGLDDNRNGIIDEGGTVLTHKGEGEQGEPVQGFADSNLLNDDPLERDKNEVRDVYIRNLFVLTLAVATPGDDTYDWQGAAHRTFCKEVAQWCVNVCDMRDRDFIMTRFTYDINPFDGDGWAPPAPGQPQWNTQTVFGVERPELIITEALVGHDARFSEDAGKRVQRKKPQGWIYVELYNPWTDKEAFSGELYQHSRSTQLSTGVVLDQLSPPLVQGSAASAKPVWRMLFHRRDFIDVDDLPTSRIESSEGYFARTVYFDDKPVTLPGDGTRNQWDYFRRTVQPIAPIRPGQFAVVGSRRVQNMGQNRFIKLTPSPDPTSSVVDFFGQKAGNDPLSKLPPVAIICDGQRLPGGGDNSQDQRAASVTEPGASYDDYFLSGNGMPRQSGYPDRIIEPGNMTPHAFLKGLGDEDSGAYSPQFDRPLDTWRTDESPAKLTTPGLTLGYRMVYLQRLADPSKPFHLSENPFRTIDGMWADLTVYNSEAEGDNLQFVSRERGVTAKADGQESMLWKQEPKGGQAPGGVMQQSFGRRNKSLGGEGGETATPYPWLTFLNRPFANPMELLLVPRGSSIDLLRQYDVPIGNRQNLGDVYSRPSSQWHFPHLRNFFYNTQDGTSLLGPQDWALLFEFVGVPSPWVGTEVAGTAQNYTEIKQMRPPFFNKVNSYREPGRTNLNAVSEAPPVAVLTSQPDQTQYERTFTNLNSARGSTMTGGFERPFRSYGGADLVSAETAGEAIKPIDVTIFRRESRGSSTPLFAYSATGGGGAADANPYPKRNPYFYYQSLMRMAATTTTRSNVYAIWITVGRFEAEPTPPTESHPDGYRLGAEIGWDTGAIERHRAFYMVDRTVPVACQPGQINNIQRAVMVSRLVD